MKSLFSMLTAVLMVLFVTATATAQTAFVSAGTGTAQFVDQVSAGLYISTSETHQLRGIFQYASNDGTSDYASTGLGLDLFISNTPLYVGSDLTVNVGESMTRNEFDRRSGLDYAVAYSFNFGVRLGKVMLGTGLQQFVGERDNISFIPVSARFSF